jgi:hypothetical protein
VVRQYHQSLTAKPRPCNVTRYSPPVSTSDACSRTRPVARATIVRLARALDFVRSGDCLVVWKLDRLGGSLPR